MRTGSSPVLLNVDDFGAVGDFNPGAGTGTDDAPAFQRALTYAKQRGGGTVEFGTKRYKLAQAIHIPVGVTLRGPHGVVQSGFRNAQSFTGVAPDNFGGGVLVYDAGMNFQTFTGSLWVAFDCGLGDGSATYNVVSAYDITTGVPLPNYATRTAAIYVGGTLENAYVFQAAYSNSPGSAYTDNTNWNKVWNSGFMSGLACRAYGEEATFRNLFIGGFMEAILCYNEAAARVDNVLIDCMNGIEIASSLDSVMVRNVHAYPFSAMEGGVTGSVVRRGVFMYLHDTCDWGFFSNCFSYGHKFGFVLVGAVGNTFVNIGADNIAVERPGSYGFINNVNSNQTFVSNFRCANREYGIYQNCAQPFCGSNIGMSDVNTGIYVASGDVFVSPGILDIASSGTRVGINNASGATVKMLGKITNATTPTIGAVTLL